MSGGMHGIVRLQAHLYLRMKIISACAKIGLLQGRKKLTYILQWM